VLLQRVTLRHYNDGDATMAVLQLASQQRCKPAALQLAMAGAVAEIFVFF
jgi:hypothetical protein